MSPYILGILLDSHVPCLISIICCSTVSLRLYYSSHYTTMCLLIQYVKDCNQISQEQATRVIKKKMKGFPKNEKKYNIFVISIEILGMFRFYFLF